MLATGEAVIKSLLVVDEERRRFLYLEGRQAAEFPTRSLQRNLARGDLTDRKPGPDVVEQGGGIFHAAFMRRFGCGRGTAMGNRGIDARYPQADS